MDSNFFMLFVLVVLVTYSPQHSVADISAKDKQRINDGLASGKALADVLKDGKFRDSLKKLGKNLGPYLGALGPLAGVALSFIRTADSRELAYMKRKFAEVNNKLDIITSEFQEVKNAIDWSTVTISYGTYERKIRAAKNNLERIYQVQGQARASEKANFINQYESDFDNSLQKLYDAIMNNDHVFSKNIIDAAIKQTKNHKRKVEHFSLGLIQLLIHGIKVKVSYYGMKGWPTSHVTSEWVKKMNALKKRLERVSRQIKGRYHKQLKSDVDDIARRHHGLGNGGLMQKLYDFLTDKYDWRYWFVAVYNDVHGSDAHRYSLCGGYALLHKHKKNIIISSQDKSRASRFKIRNANNVLKRVVNDINRCSMRNPGRRARALVKNMRKKTGRRCVPYALSLAVRTGKRLRYASRRSHTAYRKINKRKTCCRRWWWTSRICKRVRWNYNMLLFG